MFWDGPDGEVDDLTKHICQHELDLDIQYTKKGIADFIDFLVTSENPSNPEQKKQWKNQVKSKDGSIEYNTKPYKVTNASHLQRTDLKFSNLFEPLKLAKIVSNTIAFFQFLFLDV